MGLPYASKCSSAPIAPAERQERRRQISAKCQHLKTFFSSNGPFQSSSMSSGSELICSDLKNRRRLQTILALLQGDVQTRNGRRPGIAASRQVPAPLFSAGKLVFARWGAQRHIPRLPSAGRRSWILSSTRQSRIPSCQDLRHVLSQGIFLVHYFLKFFAALSIFGGGFVSRASGRLRTPTCKRTFELLMIVVIFSQNNFGPMIEPCRKPRLSPTSCHPVLHPRW